LEFLAGGWPAVIYDGEGLPLKVSPVSVRDSASIQVNGPRVPDAGRRNNLGVEAEPVDSARDAGKKRTWSVSAGWVGGARRTS